jgi:hypothetical protein
VQLCYYFWFLKQDEYVDLIFENRRNVQERSSLYSVHESMNLMKTGLFTINIYFSKYLSYFLKLI